MKLDFEKFDISKDKYEPVLKRFNRMIVENPTCHPILVILAGSHSYGLNIATSDVDIKFVYYQDLNNILSNTYTDYISGGLEKDSSGKEKQDIVGYEISRFIDLASNNNPNIMEMLFCDESTNILYKHPYWDLIASHKSEFLSKQCYNSFVKYAESQIKKAKGLNKAINNPMPKKRKTPVDFCYFIDGYSSIKLKKVLEEKGLHQEFCGIAKIPNTHSSYTLFYDWVQHYCFSKKISESTRNINKTFRKSRNEKVGLGFKGIEKTDIESNQLRLSSIPKKSESQVIAVSSDDRLADPEIYDGYINLTLKNDFEHIGIFAYNFSGYEKFCTDYKRYWAWVEDRNDARYQTNIQHGQNFDSKNIMHCHRLLDCAIEIFKNKKLNVRRNNRDWLLSIRNGEIGYEDVLEMAHKKIAEIAELFKASDLPKNVSKQFVNNLILDIRKHIYAINS